jgi:hypothetical protein
LLKHIILYTFFLFVPLYILGEKYCGKRVRFMVFNATFNNISVISWQSVLLVQETRVPGENHRPVACHWQTLSHNVVINLHSFWIHFRVWITFIIGDPTVIVKYKTAIQSMFLYFNLCLSVKLDRLSCSFTSTSFLIASYSFTLIYIIHVV